MADVVVQNHGSVVLVHPQTEEAKAWIEENVVEPQYFGQALVVEPRYVIGLARGMEEHGLKVA
jgi:hypothetical protein